MTYKIHVVCTGNICRSPMGEIILRHKLRDAGMDDVEVTSSGVSAEESGNPIDSRASRVLREHNYEVPSDHRAHRSSAEELREADLILAMTTGHAHSLRSTLAGEGIDTSKLRLWREFDGTIGVSASGAFGDGGPLFGTERSGKRSRSADFYTSDGDLDVPDPWYGSHDGFYDTLATVEAGADGIVEWLREQRA